MAARKTNLMIIGSIQDTRIDIGVEGSIPACTARSLELVGIHNANIVMMGFNTWRSTMASIFKNRIMIIITKFRLNPGLLEKLPADTIFFFSDPAEAVEFCHKKWHDKDIFVLGGYRLFNWFIARPELVRFIYFEQIRKDFEHIQKDFEQIRSDYYQNGSHWGSNEYQNDRQHRHYLDLTLGKIMKKTEFKKYEDLNKPGTYVETRLIVSQI